MDGNWIEMDTSNLGNEGRTNYMVIQYGWIDLIIFIGWKIYGTVQQAAGNMGNRLMPMVVLLANGVAFLDFDCNNKINLFYDFVVKQTCVNAL